MAAATLLSDLSIPTGDIHALLNYFQPPLDNSPAYIYLQPPGPGQSRKNFRDDPVPTLIRDLRGHESSFSLSQHGFAITSLTATADPSSHLLDFSSPFSIQNTYYPHIEKLLLTHIPDATRIIIWSHMIRSQQPSAPRKPATTVHIDQTPRAAQQCVLDNLSADEAERCLQGRYRIINVWRPLNGPVRSLPLAVMSAESLQVARGDVVTIERRFKDRASCEFAGVRYADGHEWFYLSGMRDDEMLLLRCFDSEILGEGGDGGWGGAPHAAFVHPKTPVGAQGRESIEVRALVFGP